MFRNVEGEKMRRELVEKIQNDFPWFPTRNPLFRSDINAPMYIDTDDGWFDLIYKLCQDIDAILKKDAALKQFSVDQVKEKFAGLRFYISGFNGEISSLVQKAEAESFKTCERCGRRGSMYISGGWYKTLCKKCAELDSEREWTKVRK